MKHVTKHRLRTEVAKSVTADLNLPPREMLNYRLIPVTEDGLQYIECKCGCNAIIIKSKLYDDWWLGWQGCDIHEYDEQGELIPRKKTS